MKKILDIDDIIPNADYNIFSNHYKHLQAALTIPISSATCGEVIFCNESNQKLD